MEYDIHIMCMHQCIIILLMDVNFVFYFFVKFNSRNQNVTVTHVRFKSLRKFLPEMEEGKDDGSVDICLIDTY